MARHVVIHRLDHREQRRAVLSLDGRLGLTDTGSAAATVSVSLDTEAAPRPAEESSRADLDACLAICATPFDIYKCNPISAN
jgi:hypothetical protein